MKRLVLLLLCVSASLLAELPPAPVLNLQGASATQLHPDILLLYPTFIDGVPLADNGAMQLASTRGTTFTQARLDEEQVAASGMLPMLSSVGYTLLPIQDIAWDKALKRIHELLSQRTTNQRLKDKDEDRPLCLLLSGETTAEEFAARLPSILDTEALIFLMPTNEDLPLVLLQKNRIWPAHRITEPLDLDHWPATLAEILNLPVPAVLSRVSILPMLTGCGFQARLLPLPAALPSCAEVRFFRQLPKGCPWVPEMTRMLPDERVFLPNEAAPFNTSLLPWLLPSKSPQGLYLHYTATKQDIDFPLGVRVVIHVNGQPVYTLEAESTYRRWHFNQIDPAAIECFILIPANVDPRALPFFKLPSTAKKHTTP